MNNDYLVSVIVPIYNVELYLSKCINSIINQTYSNLEIILVDDGSTDNCGIICDKYAKEDNRIVVIHKSNGGLSSARNAGLDASNGELIGFVDADDYLELNMYEKLIENMNQYNSDIAICDYYFVRNNKININSKFENNMFVSVGKEKFNNVQNEYSRITEPSWNKLYKSILFENIRYPKGKIFEDSYILCDILDKAKNVSYLLEPLYYYVYRKNSIIHSFSVRHFNSVDSINKRIKFFNDKRYYDLAKEEKNRKMNCLIINLSKMKRYGIKDKKIEKKYYQELVNTNKEVKWKGTTKYNKFYKVFRKPSISILAFMLRVRDLIKKQ